MKEISQPKGPASPDRHPLVMLFLLVVAAFAVLIAADRLIPGFSPSGLVGWIVYAVLALVLFFAARKHFSVPNEAPKSDSGAQDETRKSQVEQGDLDEMRARVRAHKKEHSRPDRLRDSD